MSANTSPIAPGPGTAGDGDRGPATQLPAMPLPETPSSATPIATWAEPADGSCPPGFPVKVKVSSGIFHVPGGRFYERTSPDRCYATPAAAEADGYRPAKA